MGLIALRCALPSLTDSNEMNRFVENALAENDFSFQKTCSAIINGRSNVAPRVKSDFEALDSSKYDDMYALFATVLATDPSVRAEVSDCLRSRFLRQSLAITVV